MAILAGRGAVLALVLLVAGCLTVGPPEVIENIPDEPLSAFVGVTVLPMDGGPRLERHTVVVRAGRIIAVAPDDQVKLPADVIRLGRAGQFVIPGLADMHVHYGFADDGILFLARGVTTVRNMWGASWTRQSIEAIASSLVHGPTIYSAGPLIDGPGSFWPEASIAATPEDVRRYVAETAEQGFIAVKLYDRLSEASFRAGVIEAHARGLQVYAHVPDAMDLEEVVALDVDSIEHFDAVEHVLNVEDAGDRSWGAARELVWARADPARVAPLARRLAASGVWLCPTLVVRTSPARSYADMDAARARPEMAYVHPRIMSFWRTAFERSAEGDLQETLLRTESAHRMRLRLLRALRTEGANLLIGTDTPNPYVHIGTSLHEELQFYQDAGFLPAEILRLLTSEAARFLRQEGEFGVVAEGARADLLLLDDDPESDLHALRRPAGVMAAGRWYDAEDLEVLLAEAAERVAAAQQSSEDTK